VKIGHMLVCSLGALAVAGRADAQVLYAAIGAGQPGELYTLNPATGAMLSDIGHLNDAGGTNYGITGLAFSPLTGVLYGSMDGKGSAQLVTINPTTARVTLVGPFNAGGATMTDLAFTTAGQLYGISSTGGANLYSVNIGTGQATEVGSSGITFTEGGGLAISAAGVFYSSPTNTQFGTYNPTTGAYTNITNPSKPVGGGSYGALAFNGSGVLYGDNLLVGTGSTKATHLVTLDPTTGAVTDIGPSINAIDAIAFSPVPEPSSLALLGLAAAGWLGCRWRRAAS
jgi:hypothetical protein